jgi:penicillin amidase
VYRTVHGPIFFSDPMTGTAFSSRIAAWDRELETLIGFGEMGGDHNLSEFRQSVSKIVTLHNFMYADRKGNIAYFGGGLLPILPECDGCDPRLPHLGDGSQEWQGFVPFADMPRSINPAQGYLVNWNTKPDQAHYYQQNRGDEYWGTIFRSDRIAQLLQQNRKVDFAYMAQIQHDVGTIDGDDSMRPAAAYFLPYLLRAYGRLLLDGDPMVDRKAHPLLHEALLTLFLWDRHTSVGSPAMSIFVEFMETLQRNAFGGGVHPGEAYVGAVNFTDGSLKKGEYLVRGTYNLLYHILSGTSGIDPCDTLCYGGDYFSGHADQVLIESLNDAIELLSGTGPVLGNGGSKGFGSTKIADWGWSPYPGVNWDSLDPLAVGIMTHFGKSAEQQRSTYMQAVDLGNKVTGVNVLPPGQSGFISAAGEPSPHFGDQIGLFDRFAYKPMNFDFH